MSRAESELKLPSGKELTLYDLVKFCYNFSETDLEILFRLLNKKMTLEDLSKELGLSKATVSRCLNNLLGLGFIVRTREISSKSIGRPKYTYYTTKELIESRLSKDIEKCAEAIKEFINIVIEKRTGLQIQNP
ncbi:MAG: ArsR family transcriptional regulator [Desulfurococcales archaeon]|jgi:predicted transcriptional regulator|uniref:ArsR family transcriptional regulator n=1 Tax=Fervidicoccus fontis TaxID=683846 RepID=A0A7J3SLW0_9CREN|nr:ArsR family transcriptional regulator [Desulfurococcales archaeon]